MTFFVAIINHNKKIVFWFNVNSQIPDMQASTHKKGKWHIDHLRWHIPLVHPHTIVTSVYVVPTHTQKTHLLYLSHTFTWGLYNVCMDKRVFVKHYPTKNIPWNISASTTAQPPIHWKNTNKILKPNLNKELTPNLESKAIGSPVFRTRSESHLTPGPPKKHQS